MHPRRWVVEPASRGSGETAASPKTSRQPSPPQPPSSMPPQPCSSSGASLVAHEFEVRTLRTLRNQLHGRDYKIFRRWGFLTHHGRSGQRTLRSEPPSPRPRARGRIAARTERRAGGRHQHEAVRQGRVIPRARRASPASTSILLRYPLTARCTAKARRFDVSINPARDRAIISDLAQLDDFFSDPSPELPNDRPCGRIDPDDMPGIDPGIINPQSGAVAVAGRRPGNRCLVRGGVIHRS